LYKFNTAIVNDFNKRFGDIFNKRKVDWNEHIEPMFRYLTARVATCKIEDLDSYEWLTNDSCTKLSKFADLQDDIDSATEKVLRKIKKRREEAEKKLKTTRTKVGPFEREKKEEKFPPE